jgi:hypothetical protein
MKLSCTIFKDVQQSGRKSHSLDCLPQFHVLLISPGPQVARDSNYSFMSVVKILIIL